jgi:hypothetical protein
MLHRRVDSHEQRYARFTGHTISKKVDGLNVEVHCVDCLTDSEFLFACTEIGEGTIERLLHRSIHATGDLYFARPCGGADLDSV